MTGSSTRLRAGTAAVDITPDRLLYLEGYGNRRHPATGTRDTLEARAIVFDDGTTRAAIVSADLCGLAAASVERIRTAAAARCGIPGAQVMVVYSHTHSAPAATPFAAVAVDQDYLQETEQALAEAVSAASLALHPVTLGVGEGRVDFNVNRRRRTLAGTVARANPLGAVDKRVRVLRVDAADAPAPPGTLGGRPLPQQNPLAVLFSYVCHATVLMGDNYRYSGDYPGVSRRFVERLYGADATDNARDPAGAAGAPGRRTRAIFLPGCFGNVRPHLLNQDGAFRGATDHELDVLGRTLGSEVVQVAEQIVAEPVTAIAIGRRAVRLPYATVADEASLRGALESQRPELRWWAQGMLDLLARDGSLPAAESSEVQVLRLGRHWVVATPGETTLEIGLSIERGLAELGLARPEQGELTLTVGYANDYTGYLCSGSVIGEGGYEPETAYTDYLRPGPFDPQVEPALVGTALAIAAELGPAAS